MNRAFNRLRDALNEAHNLEVIRYDDYEAESPCKTNWETWKRIQNTTEKALAEAMRREINEGK